MTIATITLNAGSGGEKPIIDTLTTVDGAAAPAGASVQFVKIGFGAAGDYKTASATNPIPVSGTFFQATQPVSGAVTVTANGVISTANSSAVVLAAGGVFTGTAEDMTEFSDIRVSVFADQASAVDGLSIQQSSNGTNWDVVDAYAIPVTTGKVFSVAANAKFVRVVYTNGAAAQTVFRLQTKLHKTYGKGSSVRPQDARTNDNDHEEVLAYNMGYNGTSWDRLRSTIANGLAVDVIRQAAVAEQRAATLHVSPTGAVNTAVTATLPAPAAGLFHYITSVQLVKVYNVLGVAAGAGVAVTSVNTPGTMAWTTEQAAGAVGTAPRVIDYQPTTPLRVAVAATATTFTAPAQLQTIWRWNISYFTAA